MGHLPPAGALVLTADFIEAWTARLAREQDDLDLRNTDDRAAFRMRVTIAMKYLKRDGARDLAEYLGYRLPHNCSHDRAVRACADAWLRKNTP